MPTPPFKVKAVFDYKSEEPDDLHFDNGQVITVTNDDDADWYTGEYTSASGQKKDGMFPRNFVEVYEPPVPVRPSRPLKRASAQILPEVAADIPQSPQEHPAAQKELKLPEVEPEPDPEPEAERGKPRAAVEEHQTPSAKPATSIQRSASNAKPTIAPGSPKPASSKIAPPPVAEKPSSFKDRIAAFNKAAAPPVAPFKPGGQPGGSAGFIKKPFVPPPPSRNAYMPPPTRDMPPQKVYRREEELAAEEAEEVESKSAEAAPKDEPQEETAKPTSLKDRIALLQRQQMEQAQKQAEAVQKKDKPKRPPKQRLESSEAVERISSDTVGDEEKAEDESITSEEISRPAAARQTTAPPPLRELVSDTNDADDSGAADTEDAQEMSTEEERPRTRDGRTPKDEPSEAKAMSSNYTKDNDQSDEEPKREDEEREEQEEDEDEDPEARRKRELRERMARLGGGMGMMSMFGPPMGAPAPTPARKPKPAAAVSRESIKSPEADQESVKSPPVPVMGLPGMMGLPKHQPDPRDSESEEEDHVEVTPQERSKAPGTEDDYVAAPISTTSTQRSIPPVPSERAAPPPPPSGTRSVPIPPQSPSSAPARPMIPPPPPRQAAPDSDEDDEDEDEDRLTPSSPFADPAKELGSPPAAPPPLPGTRPQRRDTSGSVPSSPAADKRLSRGPPPIPGFAPIAPSPQARAPPPPPPLSRRTTGTSVRSQPDTASEEEITEYDGDYDTDIASGVKHKEALKFHNRDSSYDDGTSTDDQMRPTNPPSRPMPPVPSMTREPPPPPPPSAPKSKNSIDAPRAAPPPLPPPKEPAFDDNDDEEDEYDDNRYTTAAPPPPSTRPPVPSSPPPHSVEPDDYMAVPPPARMPPPPMERPAPAPPAPSAYSPIVPDSPQLSSGMKRSTSTRKSLDPNRPSSEHEHMATELDLAPNSLWWSRENQLPPSLHGRPDVLAEFESSTSTKRGGKSTVSKDVYVLYPDYSQTTINITFDASDPSDADFKQNHQPPPRVRKDQLEGAWETFGKQLASAANNASGNTIGDGSAQSFAAELFKGLSGALHPVGTRAYGGLVYANLANASTQQFDEIRAGDIMTFRNARFAGHKGGLHTKYSMDVGKPDHVAIVIDWDGTKKKIRAWEQGREEKSKKNKVKEESFRVSDLKSGEVRVWRVMPRTWVGWE